MQKTEQKQKSGISRRNYVIARTRKSEVKKLHEWLMNVDRLELATHENPGEVYIFNRKKIDGF